ncbi:Hypothetical protein PSEBR_m1698 [Pseudomonas brassicacearum subsp. brassicacearum NFM421]|uniref:Uncharacterized protein n=1 Tax=Pseudomonas brassicacearum (strain NFM421) TaxID=994484 RepID=F2K6J7_PSEBN|nr:Hypothetical protein PSEBR_m1698 [Pseudomonas brassicacearum subsp. brassicacearum NFM421]
MNIKNCSLARFRIPAQDRQRGSRRPRVAEKRRSFEEGYRGGPDSKTQKPHPACSRVGLFLLCVHITELLTRFQDERLR